MRLRVTDELASHTIGDMPHPRVHVFSLSNSSRILVLIVVAFVTATAVCHAQQAVTGFDASTSLESRITNTPDSVIKHFHDFPAPAPTLHKLSNAERDQVMKAMEELPIFAQQAITKHVRSISFFDGIPNNGTTMTEETSPDVVFNIVLRAGILDESVSAFLTRKERTYYSGSDSHMTVSVEAGSLPAVLYVLLHECVHVVDIANRSGQKGPPQVFGKNSTPQLVQGIWENASTMSPPYRSPLLDTIYYRTGKPESIDEAEATYQALARTPFVSLYGSSNWYDDVAELVTCYYLTQELHQPYRIVLRKDKETIYSLDPMKSPLVAARFPSITAILH